MGLALMTSACASSLLSVEQPYTGDARYQTANLQYDESAVPVDQDNLEYTAEKMENALFDGDSPIFSRGDGITIRYRYVGFNEGSRVGRWLTGGIGGQSKVLLEVDFVDQSGDVVARVRGEGGVGGGLAGGSNKTGIDKAIAEVAEYAARTFR
ncbi:MAG: hypothetical protein WA907_05995 [Erythrobacter sp.]